MFKRIVKGRPGAARTAAACARRIGSTLACLAIAVGHPGWARAEDGRGRTVAQAPAHDMSSHGTAEPVKVPSLPALSERMAAPTVAPPPPPASGPGLADFERIALVRNPTLKQAAAQIDATMSRSFQAGLYPNPTVGYIQEQIGAIGEVKPTISGIMTKGRGTPGELVGGFVQQEIVTGGKLRLSRAKFAEEANAARWEAQAQTLRVLNGVRVRFFAVLAAQQLTQIHRDLVRINDDAVGTTEQLVNVGQANEPDLLQAKIEARRARVALRNAENRYRGSWENLVSLIGAPELRPTPLDARPLDATAAPLDFDATLGDLLRRSPEIQAALAEIRRSQIMVKRERREPIPNVTVQAIVGSNYEFNGLTTAGVQMSMPLPIFNRNQGTIREAQSDLARDHAEYNRVALSLRQRLADEATRYDDALQSVEDFRAGTLPMARRAYEVQLANFRQRRAAWPQVLVAQRTSFELNKEYVESLLELRRAEVVVNGMLLIDGLTPPGSPTPQGHIESVPTPR
jgi:cobalt-zinc-cadmium efflux system outer membrane protein